MRRLLMVLLVFVVLVLIAPALTGSVSQKQFHQILANLEEMLPGMAFEETQAESGWFASTNTQELVINALLFGEGDSAEDQHSGIFVETKIFHGPVIFGMGDSEMPLISFGAAVTRSRVRIVDEDDEPVELPGNIYNRISYDGSGLLSVSFDSFSEEFGNEADADRATFNWEGARFVVDYDAGLSHLETFGTVEPLSIVSADGEFRLGEISFESSADHTEFDIWVGSSSTSIEELTVVSSSAESPRPFSLKGFTMVGHSGIEEGRLSGSATLSIADLEMDGTGGYSMQITMSTDLDAATIGRLRDSLEGQDLTDAEANAGVPVEIQDAGMELLASGVMLEISDLHIKTAQGDAQFEIQLEIPASDLSGEAAAMNAIFSMSAKSNLRISRSLFDFMSESNPVMAPQMMALLQSGMLIDRGEQLTLVAIYDGGLLTVNGMPIPLPVVPQ